MILALLLATIIQMVLGELAPKNLAIARAEAIALRLSRSTLMYLTIAGPLIHVFDAASNRILRRVGIEPVEELPQGATAQDLDRIIATSYEQGLLDQDTTRLLDRGLDFRHRIAGEVMMPRVDVVTVHEDDPLTRVVELLDTGHSRFPVIGASVDEVVGVISVGEVVEVEPEDRQHVTVGSLASPPVVVPFTLPLPAVLEQLRTAHRQLAIVVDEFGGFAGIVTLEDIAEELVGEIRDEDDLPEAGLIKNPDGSLDPAGALAARPGGGGDRGQLAGGRRLRDGVRAGDGTTRADPRGRGRGGRRTAAALRSRWQTGATGVRAAQGRDLAATRARARRPGAAAMNTAVALLISLVLLVLNGFFVSAEFALVASKRHRLEQAAAEGSRSARSAIAGISELSLMLAGAQLGITLCTLGLGSLSEPAVAHLLEPLFELIGLPDQVGHVVALIIAVGGIGLLHVVLGEMAPKSWAISDPERTALLLAMPFRAFTFIVRPLLVVLNGLANGCLRLIGVTPQNELANAHGPDDLRLLIDSSREHGTLAAPEHDLLTAMLALQNTTVAQVMTPTSQLSTVPAQATAREVELTSRREGRLAAGGGELGCCHLRVRARQ